MVRVRSGPASGVAFAGPHRATGVTTCVGTSVTFPSDRFKKVVTGEYVYPDCAILMDGRLACWKQPQPRDREADSGPLEHHEGDGPRSRPDGERIIVTGPVESGEGRASAPRRNVDEERHRWAPRAPDSCARNLIRERPSRSLMNPVAHDLRVWTADQSRRIYEIFSTAVARGRSAGRRARRQGDVAADAAALERLLRTQG